MGYTGITNEENFRFVAVADTPADEIGVGLSSQGTLDKITDRGEGRGVGGMLKGVEDDGAGLVRKVELTRGIGGDVMADDSVNLGAGGLDGDFDSLSAGRGRL